MRIKKELKKSENMWTVLLKKKFGIIKRDLEKIETILKFIF